MGNSMQVSNDSTAVRDVFNQLCERHKQNQAKYKTIRMILDSKKQAEKDIEKCMRELEAQMRELKKQQNDSLMKQIPKWGLAE